MPVRTLKVPAPLGGWNTRDPVSSMPPTDAVYMTNLIPDVDGVSVRPGYEQYAELISGGGWVNTLIQWHTQFGERLIAASHSGSDHRLFDVSTSSATTIKTGYMGSKWRGAVMAGSLGLVNGADDPQRLTYAPGSGVEVADLVVSVIPPAKTAFNVIHVHKSRSYFANGAEPGFWYSEVNALGGTLNFFPTDRVALTSGNVIDIRSWSRDGGAGPQDYIVIFLDSGEILVYDGSDPSDATDWFLVSRYKLGKVLSSFPFGGKIHVVTDADYNILPDDLVTEGLSRPSKLSGAARDAVQRDASANWQVFIDPVYGWRIVNVPNGSAREQHVLNLRSGGACRFDIQANAWARFKGNLYFGGKLSKVYKVRAGDDAGSDIQITAQQAFTDLGTPEQKFVRNYRPLWTTDGDFTYGSGIAYDYNSPDFTQSLSTSEEGTPWNTSPWNTSSWSSGRPAKTEWLIGAGQGQSLSLVINGAARRRATWHHTSYRVEVGEDLF